MGLSALPAVLAMALLTISLTKAESAPPRSFRDCRSCPEMISVPVPGVSGGAAPHSAFSTFAVSSTPIG